MSKSNHKSIGAGDVHYVRHEGPIGTPERKLVHTVHRVMVTVDLDKLLKAYGETAVRSKRRVKTLAFGSIKLEALT
jgi:hypothetical protein